MPKLLDFLIEADKLKRTYRFSTMPKGARDSVADHSYGLALMTLIVAEEYQIDVDIAKAVGIALKHDIQEYITGEIDSKRVANGEISKEEKRLGELKAVREIERKYGWFGKEICEGWFDFEEGRDRENLYVKALDKIEAMTHLISVGGEHHDNDWRYTATYADEAVRNFPEINPLLKEVKKKLREECERMDGEWKAEYDLV